LVIRRILDTLALQLQQTSLPRREERRAPAFIGSDGIQRAAWRNEGRLQPVLVRDCVPATPQRFRSPLHLRSRTCSYPATADGPCGFRQVQSLLCRIAKRLATARRKMAEVGSFTRGECLCGPQQ
jgi:hypothetical protein